MKKNSLLPLPHYAWLILFCTWLFGALPTQASRQTNPRAVTALLERIGGKGAAKRFITVADPALAPQGKDIFILTSQDGKPCIKGNSVLSIATGINWYLNHTARINLCWNSPTADLATCPLPLPRGEERHICTADYRYYLNYCTFSYSMSTWTWERWQQEIDWMALHGINLPLQIVGLDVVWKKLLTQDLGYSSAEADRFIAGPCFQAWWGMNNLEGWGGPNPEWWYKRQEALARKIVARQRELGMQPVLPGYSGMVPSNIEQKGYAANRQGNWCSFVRPYILNPNSQAFADVAALYYKRLAEVMGTSGYYSMDPFHEGANTEGIDVPSAYSQIARAMMRANSGSKWVIQSWQWSKSQSSVLQQVPVGRLVILDLCSDSFHRFADYGEHESVYCALPNFGGRTGLFGRLTKMMNDFFALRTRHPHIKGIGATPEAIEQVPVLYDALFELPWTDTAPEARSWLAGYTVSRYGTRNARAQAAWEKLRLSALNCPSALQGPHEAVFCARPALRIDRVSTWGGTHIFYNPHDLTDAAALLLEAADSLHGSNYDYDLADFCRQTFTDYGYFLLQATQSAHAAGQTEAYRQRRDAYLQLMLDLDSLLCTNSRFMVGRWTGMARAIADEAKGTTEDDRRWLETDNARMLITTWGPRAASEQGGLRDYSYREWGGMLKDFYYPRWKSFFHHLDSGQEQPDWFASDSAWVRNSRLSYTDRPTGNTTEAARRLFKKYFIPLRTTGGSIYYVYRHVETDACGTTSVPAARGKEFRLPLAGGYELPPNVTATLSIDLNRDGHFAPDETADNLVLHMPASISFPRAKARMCLSDGTVFCFDLLIE